MSASHGSSDESLSSLFLPDVIIGPKTILPFYITTLPAIRAPRTGCGLMCIAACNKKQSHDAAFFSFQLVSSLWIATIFVLKAFCRHSVKRLNGFKRRSSRVSDDLVLHQQRIEVAVKMVTQQTSSWLVNKHIWIVLAAVLRRICPYNSIQTLYKCEDSSLTGRLISHTPLHVSVLWRASQVSVYTVNHRHVRVLLSVSSACLQITSL